MATYAKITSACRRLAAAGLGGALGGLASQRHHLAHLAWDHPAARLLLGLGLGALLGALLAWAALRLQARLAPGRQAWSWAGGLLLLALLAGPAWPLLAKSAWSWLGLGLWPALAWWLPRLDLACRAFLAARRPGWWRGWLFGGVLLLALGLRLSGLGHGLPLTIPHCDTPKQLAQIPQFVSGDFDPGFSYPLGHIYLYSGIISLWRGVTGASQPLPELDPNHPGPAAGYILTARAIQVVLGVGCVLWLVLIGRGLWGWPAGLLAGLLLALDPLHLTYSRQVMGDLPQTFWVLASLGAALAAGRQGGWGLYLLSGLLAGLAVASKLFGGYVVLAGLAAWWLSPSRRWRGLLALGAGLLLGWALGSPLLWQDPATWLEYLRNEIASQFAMPDKVPLAHDRLAQIAAGLAYFFRLLVYRLGWPWSLALPPALVWLWRQPQRRALAPLLAALTVALAITALRLPYLREWDLVHLTPFLHLALAGAGLALWRRFSRPGAARLLVGSGLALLLLWQGLIALSWAEIARWPDTRQYARAWLERHLPPGQTLAHDLFMSAYFWPPEGYRLLPEPVREVLRRGERPGGEGLALAEWPWWEPRPDPARIQPLQEFALRNGYWEDPAISLNLPRTPRPRSELILWPPWVEEPGSLGFLDTHWSRRQPLHLAGDPDLPASRRLQARQGLPPLGLAVLGQGQARLELGWGFSRRLDPQAPASGPPLLEPLPALVPLWPRTYDLALAGLPPQASLWVALFPQPADLAPLLARSGEWSGITALSANAARDPEAPAEYRLFLAAAQAAQGHTAAARQTLADLERERPGFLAAYARLVQAPPGPAWDQALAALVQPVAGPWWRPELTWRRSTAAPGSFLEETTPQRHHLWLRPTFLPGRLALGVDLEPRPIPQRLRVVAHRPGVFTGDLAHLPIPARAEAVSLSLEIPKGPVGLELILETPEGQAGPPLVLGYTARLDLPAELAWRWGLLAGLLPGRP